MEHGTCLLCQCTPAMPINGIYMEHEAWNKICCVNAHLPINGTCFTHTHDLLCEYIYLCKSTKSIRQTKHIVLFKSTKSKNKHNTTKYFILCQCTLTLIKVKTIIVTLCHMHTKLPILFLAHPMTLHIF